MPNLYIIAGCNGAGKTTASYTILPEILNCRQFVNADNIAAGLSPFNPESVALEAGRTMLNRINELMKAEVDFAIETTLSTRSYVSLIAKAHSLGYKVNLLYFWLSSTVIAVSRVATRVANGGHHIPSDVVERRYYRGIHNLHNLYMPLCDQWVIIDNMDLKPDIMDQSLHVIGEVSFTDKVMFDLRIALRRMTEQAALHDRSLVIGDKDGTFKLVPAKELLETLPK